MLMPPWKWWISCVSTLRVIKTKGTHTTNIRMERWTWQINESEQKEVEEIVTGIQTLRNTSVALSPSLSHFSSLGNALSEFRVIMTLSVVILMWTTHTHTHHTENSIIVLLSLLWSRSIWLGRCMCMRLTIWVRMSLAYSTHDRRFWRSYWAAMWTTYLTQKYYYSVSLHFSKNIIHTLAQGQWPFVRNTETICSIIFLTCHVLRVYVSCSLTDFMVNVTLLLTFVCCYAEHCPIFSLILTKKLFPKTKSSFH